MTGISVDIQGFEVERLSEHHINGILELMNREGWFYYDYHELERYSRHNQECFVLLKDERVHGSIFTTNYINQIWIGNIVVAEEVRGLGLATKMIRAVMDYLHQNTHIHTFRLASVPLAIGLYKKIGFHPEIFTTSQEIELPIKLEYEETNLAGDIRVERLCPNDLESVSLIDKRYFKSKRLWLLESIYNDSIRESCFCLRHLGRIVGFLMIRRRRSSKKEAGFSEGPDYAYRLGPSCILPECGIEGFKHLFQRAIQAIDQELEHLEGDAKLYVVFPKNAVKDEIYQETNDMAVASGLGENVNLDSVFNEHDYIFGAPKSSKNEDQWNYMQGMGFRQQYFEQIMSYTYEETVDMQSMQKNAETMADTEGIFASTTPGDKA